MSWCPLILVTSIGNVFATKNDNVIHKYINSVVFERIEIHYRIQNQVFNIIAVLLTMTKSLRDIRQRDLLTILDNNDSTSLRRGIEEIFPLLAQVSGVSLGWNSKVAKFHDDYDLTKELKALHKKNPSIAAFQYVKKRSMVSLFFYFLHLKQYFKVSFYM